MRHNSTFEDIFDEERLIDSESERLHNLPLYRGD